MKKVVFVLLPEYADWEAALLAGGLKMGFGMWEPAFDTCIAAPTLEPVTSVGGFRVIPDCTFETVPDDFAAMILVGGMSWFERTGTDTSKVLPLAEKAVKQKAILGAICDASMFLGVHGFLNAVRHTSNDLALLKKRAGSAYTGEALYNAKAQSVKDGNIITANGVGFIEFARDVFTALNVAPSQEIEAFYSTCKNGFFTI